MINYFRRDIFKTNMLLPPKALIISISHKYSKIHTLPSLSFLRDLSMLLASRRLSRKVEVAPANSLNSFWIVLHKRTTVTDRPVDFANIKHVAYLYIIQILEHDTHNIHWYCQHINRYQSNSTYTIPNDKRSAEPKKENSIAIFSTHFQFISSPHNLKCSFAGRKRSQQTKIPISLLPFLQPISQQPVNWANIHPREQSFYNQTLSFKF